MFGYRGIHALALLSALFLLSCEGSKPSAPDAGEDLAIEWTEGNTIVCMGTSLTFGFGEGCKVLPPQEDCEADSSYPSLLQKRLKIPVVNLGAPFARAADGVRRLDEALARRPVLALLEFGGNDLFNGTPVSDVREDLATMIERLQGAGVRVALLSFAHPDMAALTPAGHRYRDRAAEGIAYHRMMVELADAYGLPLADYIFAGIWWEEELMYDEVHPNGPGYVKMEENIYLALADIFAASGMLR